MTANSDERREVAERLRELAAMTPRDGWMTISQNAGFIEERNYALGIQSMGLRETVKRIADLIDPTCSMDAIDTGEQADYECREHIMHCSNCGAEFGYVLYGEDGDVSMDDKPKFCPECGKRVVSDDDQ